MIEFLRRVSEAVVLLLCLLVPGIMHAQVFLPEDGFVYGDAEVPRIDVTMAEADLENLYADRYSNTEYSVQFKFTRGDVAEEVAHVGIRFRGNTSRDKDKMSFQLSFNTFESGRDFYGVEKLNLNAETNDPSMVRSKLSWSLFRYLGIAGSRSNHVLLFINNDFYGVYINTEHIDEKFVRSRFGTNDGNLYKCLWPADLVYLGSGEDAYKEEHSGRRAYSLRINEEWDDYQDLAGLIAVLDQFSGSQLMEELERVMNVQQYLKIMAVDVMTGDWDGYIWNKNNFYLYRDQVTGRFEYIAYDLDNTFGIDWVGEDWSNRSIYNWHNGQRPLWEKIMQQEVYRQQYTGYIKQLAAYMTSGAMIQEVERWRDQITSWVSQDPYYSLDFGYTFSDFENALTTGIEEDWWLPYGVLEYASIRAASALEECIQADAPPLISHARVNPSLGRLRIDWTIEDDATGLTTSLHYRIDQGSWQTVSPPGPAHTDLVSGIGTYRDSVYDLADDALVELYFTAVDQGAQETRYPAGQITIDFPLANGPLLINEFMASNSKSNSDQYGEYDDWVEIFNPTTEPVWLGDLYLSDNVGVPGKYRFPDGYINPDGFFVVWLDGQPEQGEKHASFKISKDGEELRLSSRPAEGFAIMDSLTFGPQETDVALGRSTDGGTLWMAYSMPTPGFSNLSTGMDQILADQPGLVLYPNPVTGGVLHFSSNVSGTIYDAMGKPVLQVMFSDHTGVESLIPGIYIFRPDTGEPVRFLVSGGW